MTSREQHPLERIDNTFAHRLCTHRLEVRLGIDQTVVDALMAGTADPEITKHTHDARRFPSPEAVRDWSTDPEKQRVIYSLADTAVQGVIWYSQENDPFSGAPTTFAIRMYEAARGRGLAGDFLEAAHEDFVSHQGGGDVWLRVRRDNEGARNLYLRHRYQITHQTRTFQWMVRRVKQG